MSKRILITGATRGIGLETVRLLREKGHRIVAVGRDFTEFPFSDDRRVEQVAFDVGRVDRIPELVEKIGAVDVLINNAGISRGLTYLDYTEEAVDEILRVNIKAPVALIREVSKGFLKKGEGRVVNVASQAAQVGHPDVWYGITKAGLVNATVSFADVLGAYGVVVNAVAPGPVSTAMLGSVRSQKRLESILDRTYLGRSAAPEEVAEVIAWLAVESPAYINGEVFNINNGAQFVRSPGGAPDTGR